MLDSDHKNMETEHYQKKVDTNPRSILSFIITLFGLLYLLLLLSGQIDKESKRFQIPEVIIFTVVLLLNSENLQRLSKLQFGKDGVSLELNEIKQGQNEIKQNQERIQATQQEQRKSITELTEICERFLDNNQPLVAMLKRASEVSITDRFLPDKSSTSEVYEDTSKKTLPAVLSHILKLAKTDPDLLDSIVTELKKERQLPKDETL